MSGKVPAPGFEIAGHCLACGEPSLVAAVGGSFECIADPCGAAFKVEKVRPPRWERGEWRAGVWVVPE